MTLWNATPNIIIRVVEKASLGIMKEQQNFVLLVTFSKEMPKSIKSHLP